MTFLVVLYIFVMTPSLAALVWVLNESPKRLAQLDYASREALKVSKDAVETAHPLISEMTSKIQAMDRELTSLKSRASSVRLIK